MLDYTALLKKLRPDRDGEPYTSMRTGVVDVINSDGTLDIEMSGVIVPNVPRLDTVNVATGSVVHMIVFRGSLLVIGRTSDAGGRIIAYASETTDSTAGASGVEVSIIQVTGTLQNGRAYRVWAEFHATPGSAGVAGAVRIREGSGIAGTASREKYADFPNTGAAGNHFLLSARFVAGSTGSQTFTATAQASGATMRREAASIRLSEMWIETADA